MKKELWRALGFYIADRRNMLLFLCLCALSIGCVCVLLGAPLAGVVYGLLLCGFFGVIFGAFDFSLFISKHEELSRLLKTPLADNESLPEPRGLIERDYDALLKRLMTIRLDEQEARDGERRDMRDYYALWAHQVKVPISAMQLLLRETKNSAALSGELFRIEQYVDMALGYERLNSKSTDYVIRKYKLDDIVRQAARRFAPLFIQKRLSINIEPTELTVLTDEKWLVFVLEQILSNAVKYTKSGCVSIRRDGDSQRLIIADTGIGIRAEDLPRVFEQGYTGYNGRVDKRATGLGLYLCKRTMDALGHGISIKSVEGQGTEVVLDFTVQRLYVE